ncbi:MAG: hypothetical protein AB1458_09325 [Bacteroidota bacterium]
MKALSVTGLVLGTLLLLLSLYLQFSVVPSVEYMEAMYIEGGDMGAMGGDLWMAAHEGMMNMAYTCLIGGGLALILSIIPFIKTKNKLALAGVLFSLVALVIGLMHGTHMFS